MVPVPHQDTSQPVTRQSRESCVTSSEIRNAGQVTHPNAPLGSPRPESRIQNPEFTAQSPESGKRTIRIDMWCTMYVVPQRQSVAPIAPFWQSGRSGSLAVWSASTWRTIALGPYLRWQAGRRSVHAPLPSIFPIEMVLERLRLPARGLYFFCVFFLHLFFPFCDLRSEFRLEYRDQMPGSSEIGLSDSRETSAPLLYPPSARQELFVLSDRWA